MSKTRTSLIFALASLAPGMTLLAAALWGGLLPYVGLAMMTVMVFALDKSTLAARATNGQRNLLPLSIGALHFMLLFGAVSAVARWDFFTNGQIVALLVGMGLFFGQISNACAHELIHRPDRFSRKLGSAIYVSLLNGQHVSAHLLVHHVHAGTDRDPNSAPLGRGFYRYLIHASRAEFIAGWRAETNRRKSGRVHPYVFYLAGSLFSLTFAFWIAGLPGIIAWFMLAFHAQTQLLLSDYVQHYGLRRRISSHGKPEAMAAHHSWNAPQRFSGAMMLNAPLHSDHHMRPDTPFDALSHTHQTMPTLPYSVPVMGAIALCPPLWRHLMDPRAQRWGAPETAKKSPDTGSIPIQL